MRSPDDAEGLLLDGRYEVGPRLGLGGSAAVHRAWDRERGRAVAVKLLPPGAAPADDRPGRSESDILAALDHPRLVALHDVLRTEHGTALVMELVDGPSLHERLAEGPLALDEVAVVVRDVAAGLAHAHRRGVVHRDVKPGNVLLRLEHGRVVEARLTDFGIARRGDATRTTGERTVVGTLRFLSPEQARGERVTAASDVYSLGLTALAALTGADAFPGGEAESLAGRLLRPPPIPEGLPGPWAELLRAMTEVDPEARIDASATAALASGSAVERSRPATSTRPIDLPVLASLARPRRRRSRLLAPVVGTALTGALLGGAVAAVLAPAAVERALAPAAGAAPGPASSAPVAVDEGARPTAVAAPETPATAAPPAGAPTPTPPARTAQDVAAGGDDHPSAHEDRHGRGSGASGHGSGSSGHGAGGHGSDD